MTLPIPAALSGAHYKTEAGRWVSVKSLRGENLSGAEAFDARAAAGMAFQIWSVPSAP